jgi:hypothetical protein
MPVEMGTTLSELRDIRYMLNSISNIISSFNTNTDIDNALSIRIIRILKTKTISFEFVRQISKGAALLVGEGNLSFSKILLRKDKIRARWLTATTYEKESGLTEEARSNACILRLAGAQVLHGVDATKLDSIFGATLFESIVFMFPNVASRIPVRGRNPNFVLARDFLRSAARHLARDDRVMVTAVNSPHYLGAFSFHEAARIAGFQSPEVYRFNPASFPGYVHTMTHRDESALAEHDRFSLWVFSLKRLPPIRRIDSPDLYR